MDWSKSLLDKSGHHDSGYSSSSSCLHQSTPLSSHSRKRKVADLSGGPDDSILEHMQDFHLLSSPNTPEKQLRVVQSLDYSSTLSPIQERCLILYRNLKPVKPPSGTKRLLQSSPPPLTRSPGDLLEQVLRTPVVMSLVFERLSDGDLFRFGKVSRTCLDSLRLVKSAFERFARYESAFANNKENYSITPPSSPEQADSPLKTIEMETFNLYYKVGKRLLPSQRLDKCRKCTRMAIVQNNILQCQSVNSCGFICCLQCSSLSTTGPRDFFDKCGGAVLRPKLGDLSNSLPEPGPRSRVKKNLFDDSINKPFANHNNRVGAALLGRVRKREPTITFTPVLPGPRCCSTPISDPESSPPRFVGVGSKQSKRNLKRLTR